MSQNSVSSQGNTKFYLKVIEELREVWERVSLLARVMWFQKTLLALLGNNFFYGQ